MSLTPALVIWMNGEFVPWDKAQIHVLTHGLHYGSSVFEGLRAYPQSKGTSILALDAHVQRFFQSCKIIGLPLEYQPSEIREAIRETVKRNGHDHCYIRPIAWRGYGSLGVWADDCPIQVAIASFSWNGHWSAEAREKGLDVGVSSWRRMAPDTLPAMAKSAGNYVNSALVVQEARANGYHDGIALDVEGFVSEGSGANIFLVQGGRLHTPPIGASILSGVTRAIAIQIATDLSIPVVQMRVPREMLYTADELFFSGTAAEISPIRSVDRKPVGQGARGPVTQSIQERFFGILKGEYEDRHGWLTAV
ncbi:MAG: branched-chain amino acid transaminase [Planctomycetota bacterium]